MSRLNICIDISLEITEGKMDKCKLVDDGNLSSAKHIVALMPEQFHTKDIIPHCIPKPPCYRDNDKPCGRMLSGWRDELNIEKLPGNCSSSAPLGESASLAGIGI